MDHIDDKPSIATEKVTPAKESGAGDLLDLRINIGAETDEPSIRQMIRGYYQAAGYGYDWGRQQADRFFAALEGARAAASSSSASPDRPEPQTAR